MYHHFKGTLDLLELNYAVVDCVGVGYKLIVSGTTHRELTGKIGNIVTLLAHLSIREDATELYGFATDEEIEAFRLLISVSGVGPKAAISILTALTPDGLADAISRNDQRAISAAQGVGAKTAARVILELHDKFGPLTVGNAVSVSRARSDGPSALGDALEALSALGYTRTEAAAVLRQVKNDGRDSGDIIKDALKLLMKK